MRWVMGIDMAKGHGLFLFTLFMLPVLLQGCEHPSASTSASTPPSQQTASQDSHRQDSSHQNSHSQNSHSQNNRRLNVVSPDWGIAGTLTAMGYPPIATGDIRAWDQWVGKPKLPDSVTDLGIRYQPNAELVAQLPVDMVLDNYFYEHARNLYGDVPSDSVLYMSKSEVATWDDYVKPTQKLGKLIQQPEAAEAYIADSYAQIEQAGKLLHQRYPNVHKFAVVQFIDANNMRMYSYNSLFSVLFAMMDFEFVALDKGNQWGFTPIQLGDLTQLDDDVCLLIIEPLPPITEVELQNSLVWQRLGYGVASVSDDASANLPAGAHGSRCMAKLEPVWIYGGMSSITVLADNLAAQTLVGGRNSIARNSIARNSIGKNSIGKNSIAKNSIGGDN